MVLEGDTTAKGAEGTDGPGLEATQPVRGALLATQGRGGEQAGTIWKVPPNEAVEAKAANEFSRQPDILRRGEAEGGVEESRRKGEPGAVAKRDLPEHTGVVGSTPFPPTPHLLLVP